MGRIPSELSEPALLRQREAIDMRKARMRRPCNLYGLGGRVATPSRPRGSKCHGLHMDGSTSYLSRFDSFDPRRGSRALPFGQPVTQGLDMPIRFEHRWPYPIDRLQVPRRVRFTRAQGRCDHCLRPHRRDVRHLGSGLWRDEDRTLGRTGRGKPISIGVTPLMLLNTAVGVGKTVSAARAR